MLLMYIPYTSCYGAHLKPDPALLLCTVHECIVRVEQNERIEDAGWLRGHIK